MHARERGGQVVERECCVGGDACKIILIDLPIFQHALHGSSAASAHTASAASGPASAASGPASAASSPAVVTGIHHQVHAIGPLRNLLRAVFVEGFFVGLPCRHIEFGYRRRVVGIGD